MSNQQTVKKSLAVVTLIVGTILAFSYSKIRTGNSSLKKEA